MMDAMEETLYQHGVDAIFAGHVHAYESSYPVFRSGTRLPAMAAINHLSHSLTCYALHLDT